MFNRTIRRLCGFSVGFWVLIVGRSCGPHFWGLLRREPDSPEVRLTFGCLLRGGRARRRWRQNFGLSSGQGLLHRRSSRPDHHNNKKKHPPATIWRALLSFLYHYSLTQQPSLRLPFRGSIPRPSPSSSIPHVCGTGRN